jgi:N,N'-diacetyllegionaminate synthase
MTPQMNEMKKQLGVSVGYSDHSEGIEVAIAAVALGARVIEKHFTTNNSLPGPDHRASLEAEELTRMIRSIRNIEKSLGSADKNPTPSEKNNINAVRKSIVAIDKIKKGDLLTEFNIGVKRPGSGISPMQWDHYINTTATKDYDFDDLI